MLIRLRLGTLRGSFSPAAFLTAANTVEIVMPGDPVGGHSRTLGQASLQIVPTA